MQKHLCTGRARARLFGLSLGLAYLIHPQWSWADTVVAPGNMAAADATFGSGVLRAANYRALQVYGATHFPPDIALVISEIRFRPDRTYGFAFTTTIDNIQINMSTTERSPESLSSVYGNNVGFDDTTVFSGPLSISSSFTGPAGGPKNFDIIIPLQTPFLYNPAAGNLVVDIRNYSGNNAATYLSGQFVAGDAAGRMGGSAAGGSGSPDSGIEAIQIVYTPTNQPPVPPKPLLLTRGPYLQSATTSNLIVRWRTSLDTNSAVRFGLSPDQLDWGVSNDLRTGEHELTLTNLAPDTKYYYAIGAAGTNLAGGDSYYFLTPPAGLKPTRIWAIGDAGTANQGLAGAGVFGMRDAYYAYSSNRYTDLMLMLGDNAYGIGTDDEYSTNVFGTFPAMLRQTVVWSTIGNHDAVNAATYQSTFSFPKNGEAGGVPSGTELYYSFDYANIHFVCLDSEVSSNARESAMLTWLEQDLQNNTNQWVIAFWHSPPYNYGSHDSDNIADSGGRLVQMRFNVVPYLEFYGVDLVLCGHSHAYERSYLLNGHYGYARNLTDNMRKDAGSGREDDSGAYLKPTATPTGQEGAVYVVCGSSGWVTPPVVPLDKYLKHPAHYIGLPKVGSMVLDITTNRLDAKFLTANGTVQDYFTIRKGVAPEPLKMAGSRLSPTNFILQFKTIAGKQYQVERASDITLGDWAPVSETLTASGATTRWTNAPSGETGFYRITELAPQ